MECQADSALLACRVSRLLPRSLWREDGVVGPTRFHNCRDQNSYRTHRSWRRCCAHGHTRHAGGSPRADSVYAHSQQLYTAVASPSGLRAERRSRRKRVFTGIIEEVGEVVAARAGELRVRAEKVLRKTKPGDSLAVDGVDLTLTAIVGRALRFDVMPETYRQTTLGRLQDGRRVNLERSIRAADRLSGHVVRGVVEGIGRVCKRRRDGDATVITYSAPEHILACMVERGPISVDGVSLTVIAKGDQTFSVSIVAFTGDHTNVLERAVGDPVNVESDIMMRYVAQAVKNRGGS